MYRYIDKLLLIKLYIDKSKTGDYMVCYIVFVYNKLDKENAFKNEIEKYTRKNQKREEEDKTQRDSRKSQEITMNKRKKRTWIFHRNKFIRENL